MKKYASYILMVVALTGLLSPVTQVQAQAMGYCQIAGGSANSAQTLVTQDSCTIGTFTLVTNGTCEWVPGDTSNDPKQADNYPCTPPPVAASTTTKSYALLAPLPCPGTGVTGCTNQFSTFDATQNSSLGLYLNIVIKIVIGVAGVLAMIMIVLGGIQYMTSDFISSKEEGKKRITNAIFGLILAVGSWLLLNQINPDLLNSNFSSLTNQTVDIDAPQAPTTVNGTQMYGNNASGVNWAAIAGDPTTLPSGVTTDHPGQDCDTVGQTGCTSLRGLSLSYVNTIIANCPSCEPLTITGGTEYWRHRVGTTHGPGSPTVDLRLTSALTQYITGGATPVSGQRYSQGGISFLYEGDHWHAGQ